MLVGGCVSGERVVWITREQREEREREIGGGRKGGRDGPDKITREKREERGRKRVGGGGERETGLTKALGA
jgi:hypothetical protein